MRRYLTTGSAFERDFAYSRAVVQEPFCFVSGITGYDYARMTLADGIVAQAEQAFKTLSAVLDEAGFGLQDIVRVQYTLTDRDLAGDLSGVLQRWLGSVRPAATLVLAELLDPDMLIEIEVTALRSEG